MHLSDIDTVRQLLDELLEIDKFLSRVEELASKVAEQTLLYSIKVSVHKPENRQHPAHLSRDSFKYPDSVVLALTDILGKIPSMSIYRDHAPDPGVMFCIVDEVCLLSIIGSIVASQRSRRDAIVRELKVLGVKL